MIAKRWMATGWRLAAAALLMGALAACNATPTPTATPVPMPAVTVEVSDSALTMPADTPAGLVAVTVKNSGQAPHSPLFARLNDGVTQEQFMETMQTDESGTAALAMVSLLGGAQVQPGGSQQMEFDFKPGAYLAIDMGEGEGPPLMANFTATAGSGPAPAEPAATVNAELIDFQFTLPDQIKSGAQTWKIANKGGQWHEMGIFKLNEGVTVDDVMAMMMSGEESQGPPPFETMAFWAPMSQGEHAWLTIDLPPGTYTVLCFLPDFSSTPPMSHLEHGMVRTLTVTE